MSWCLGLASVLMTLAAFAQPAGEDLTSLWVKASAYPPVLLWFAGVHQRLAWRLGVLTFWLHVAIAFHLAHGDRFDHAWNHVQTTSGWGNGLYVSFVFGAVWTFDVLFGARNRWWRVFVLVFTGFIVFNATVIFGGLLAKLTGIVGLLSLLISYPPALRETDKKC